MQEKNLNKIGKRGSRMVDVAKLKEEINSNLNMINQENKRLKIINRIRKENDEIEKMEKVIARKIVLVRGLFEKLQSCSTIKFSEESKIEAQIN